MTRSHPCVLCRSAAVFRGDPVGQFDGLDGLPFPARSGTFPAKDQMADYLEDYARHFRLPLRNGVTDT